MKNYKINIDKPKPTQEEILAGRNFDSVLAQYKAAPGQVIKKPFWQSTAFISSVVAVAATVAIVALVLNKNGEGISTDPNAPGIANNDPSALPGQNTPDNAVAWTPTKRTIAPPLAGVNIPFKEYKVNSKKGGTISYPTGSKVTFQPNSFVDANGASVTGNVDVQYREMHDAVDFFLAGVPMEYDSAGATYQLESAGMVEVAAFVNGQVVYLDKNKPMQVEMASAQSGTDYNLYQFDAGLGNWVYQGKDAVSAMVTPDLEKKKDSVMKTLIAQRDNLVGCISHGMDKPADAMKPVKADPSKNRFRVDFNKKEFPEMAAYQNVIFEVDESKEKFDAANYSITWEKIALSRGDSESKYKLNLTKGLKQVKLDVYPVLDGQEYVSALANYEKAHAKYVADSTSYVTWTANRAQYGNNGAGVPMPELTPAMIASLSASEALVYNTQRAFSLSSFGIYNMDAPEHLPQGSIVDLTLNGPDNQLFTGYQSIYHVDRQKNTLMNYHDTNPVPEFHCNTKSQNLVWAVKEGELYYAENESFAGLPLSGKVVLTLKKVAKKLNSADEMRAFFGLKAPSNSK
jgi:hypothetical protein